jgi:hypothetical protein
MAEKLASFSSAPLAHARYNGKDLFDERRVLRNNLSVLCLKLI